MFRPNDFKQWVRKQAPHLTRAKFNAFESGAWSVFLPTYSYYPSMPHLQALFDDGAEAARRYLCAKSAPLCCDKCERELPAFIDAHEGKGEGRG